MAVLLNSPDNHSMDGLKTAVFASMGMTALAVIAPIGLIYVIYRNWK